MKKLLVSAALVIAVVSSAFIAACGNKEHNHEWVLVSTTATCSEDGVTTYSCSCGETKTEPTPATGNHNFENHVCTECGYIDFKSMTVDEAVAQYGYYIEDTDNSNTYSVGDIVYFGSYPQSTVKDEALLSSLSAAQGVLPSQDSHGDWQVYPYYADGAVSDFMYYKDVTVNNAMYRGVYLSGYRPYYAALSPVSEYSYIDDAGYELGTVYWFAYEPVKWLIMDYSDGNLFLSSKYCIDGQPFNDAYEISGSELVIPDSDNYINNWEYSSVRAFLNGSFYQTAFGDLQKSLIQSVTLDNATTGASSDNAYQTCQNDTEDKVFLLSAADVSNADYGYTSKGNSRNRSFTDYAVIQGVRTSSTSTTADGDPTCFYLLRSAGNSSYTVCGVSKMGSVSAGSGTGFDSTEDSDGYAYNADSGVLPALYIKIND